MSALRDFGQIVLLVLTGIFWMCGLGIMAVGIWIKADQEFANLGQAIKVGLQEELVEIVTWLFIGTGIFVFAVGFAGCLGAIRQSKVMLGFFIFCVFIVFLAEAGAGTYAGIRKDAVKTSLEETGSDWIKQNYNPHPEAETSLISRGFNYVQQKWECCGVKNFLDYHNSTYLTLQGSRIKKGVSMSFACCKSTDTIGDIETDDINRVQDQGLLVPATDKDSCMQESIDVTALALANKTMSLDICDQNQFFRCTGCVQKVIDWAEQYLIVILGVGIAIGVLQLILLVLSLWFCLTIGSYKEQKDEKNVDEDS